jgi:hypothetical protein
MMPCNGQFHEFHAVGTLFAVYLFHNTVCASVDGIGLLVCEFDDRIEICLHPLFGFDNITQMYRQVVLIGVEQQQPHLEIMIVFLKPACVGGSENEYTARIKVVTYIVDLHDTVPIQDITNDKGVYGKQIL